MFQKKEPSIIKNYIYNLTYQLLAIVLPLVVTPYISRTLRAEAIGAYSYCSSITTYFSLLSILGLNLYGQLEISKCRNDTKNVTETFWGIFFAKSVTSVCAIFLYFLMILYTDTNKFIFFSLSLLLFSNSIDISWFYQGIEKFKKTVIRNLIIKTLSLILIFVFVKNETDVVRYALILNGSTFIANVSLWLPLKNFLCKCDRHAIYWHLHVKNAIPYFIPTLASSIYTVLDKSMLGWIGSSNYENGIYEQTHKIVLAAATVVSSLSTVMLPRMSFLFSQNRTEEYKNYLYRVLSSVGIISFPICFGMIAVADHFIPVFLGKGYDKCIILLKIFSPLVFFSGLNTVIGSQCLIAKGEQAKYNLGVVSGAIANVLLNLLLISHLLSIGAVVASVSAEGIILGIFLFSTRKDINMAKMLLSWVKAFVASMIMFVVVKSISNINGSQGITLLIQITAGCIMYFVILLVLKESMLSEILYKVKAFFKKIARI